MHVEDPGLLPELVMVRYQVPDEIGIETVLVEELPEDWRFRQSLTQGIGDRWYGAGGRVLLRAPSVIVPLRGTPDVNVMINHRHSAVTAIRIAGSERFVLDTRLF